MSNIFFHIGYPKSASTTLQKRLFNKHTDIINLGLYPTGNIGIDTDISESCPYLTDPHIKLFYDNLLKLDEITYRKIDNKKILQELISKYKSKDKCLLFSEERLTSVFNTHNDIGVKALRVKEILPNAKIIVVIRNQFDAIKSLYADFPFDPRSFSIGEPLELNVWLDIIYSSQYINYSTMLNYFDVISFYENLFGRNNICVLLFEDLVKNKSDFSEKISSFMGICPQQAYEILSFEHENKRVSHKYNVLRSVKRKYFKNIRIRKILGEGNFKKIEYIIKIGRAKNYTFNNESIEIINNKYAESNSKLNNKYDLNINKYLYPR